MNLKHSIRGILVQGLAFLALAVSASLAAEQTATVRGKVTDADGRAVPAARVFAYNDRDVRRPADTISAPTGDDGLFRMVMPAGTYWMVARLKKGEEFGPLMPGDRHSGEPVVVELAPGQEAELDFMVLDLRDARRKQTRQQERPIRISGRIIDGKGAAVTRAYAFAQLTDAAAGVPDFFSAWTDSAGNYVLTLPRGTYHIGGARTFPPDRKYFLPGQLTAESDRSGVDIVLGPPDVK